MRIQVNHGTTQDRASLGIGPYELFYNTEKEQLELSDGTGDGTLLVIPKTVVPEPEPKT